MQTSDDRAIKNAAVKLDNPKLFSTLSQILVKAKKLIQDGQASYFDAYSVLKSLEDKFKEGTPAQGLMADIVSAAHVIALRSDPDDIRIDLLLDAITAPKFSNSDILAMTVAAQELRDKPELIRYIEAGNDWALPPNIQSLKNRFSDTEQATKLLGWLANSAVSLEDVADKAYSASRTSGYTLTGEVKARIESAVRDLKSSASSAGELEADILSYLEGSQNIILEPAVRNAADALLSILQEALTAYVEKSSREFRGSPAELSRTIAGRIFLGEPITSAITAATEMQSSKAEKLEVPMQLRTSEDFVEEDVAGADPAAQRVGDPATALEDKLNIEQLPIARFLGKENVLMPEEDIESFRADILSMLGRPVMSGTEAALAQELYSLMLAHNAEGTQQDIKDAALELAFQIKGT